MKPSIDFTSQSKNQSSNIQITPPTISVIKKMSKTPKNVKLNYTHYLTFHCKFESEIQEKTNKGRIRIRIRRETKWERVQNSEQKKGKE